MIKRGVKKEEQATTFFDEIMPKLESTCASMNESEELTAEKVINEIIQEGPMGEIGRKIIRYQAKAMAI